MKGITNAEVGAGITFGFLFFLLKALLIWSGIVVSPQLGGLGAYGFVFATAITFTFFAILVLGYFGDNTMMDVFWLSGAWVAFGFIALMLQFYSFSYFVLGLIVVMASSALASRVHKAM